MAKKVFGNLSNISNFNFNDNLKGAHKRVIEEDIIEVYSKKSKLAFNDLIKKSLNKDIPLCKINFKNKKRHSNNDSEDHIENITKSLERKVKRICIQSDRKTSSRLEKSKEQIKQIEKENSFKRVASEDGKAKCKCNQDSSSLLLLSASSTLSPSLSSPESLITKNNSLTTANELPVLDSTKYESANSQSIIILDNTAVDIQIEAGHHSYDPFRDYKPPQNLPSNVEDYDKSQLHDVFSEPNYAQDVFNFYKKKTNFFSTF